MSRAANGTHRIGPRGVDGGLPVRVILVGRTGLDAALRVDRSIELLRAGTPLDAIGELADPIDESSPRAATVVLAQDLMPPDRAPAYADALRALEPDVRVLALGAQTIDGLDGHITPGMDAHAIRRAVRPAHAPAPGQRAAAYAPYPSVPAHYDARVGGGVYDDDHEHVMARAAEAPPAYRPIEHVPVDSPAADRVILAAILAGKDAAAAAVEDIVHRNGLPPEAAPRYIASPLQPSSDESRYSSPVAHSGRVLGHLIAPALDPVTRLREAVAIAPWLLLAAQHEQLKKAAFTDDLTGAFNRRYFQRFLAAAIAQAKPARHPVSLLYFDVDDFKKYNDRYGHSAGDEILTETVRLLNSVIRPSDRVCRIGGDEFAVIFHDPEGPRKPVSEGGGAPQTIAQIAARFQKQICEHRFPKLLDQAPGTLTLSGGIATFPWDGTTPQELLERADALALQSKKQGKNVFTFGPGAERACKAHPEI